MASNTEFSVALKFHGHEAVTSQRYPSNMCVIQGDLFCPEVKFGPGKGSGKNLLFFHLGRRIFDSLIAHIYCYNKVKRSLFL